MCLVSGHIACVMRSPPSSFDGATLVEVSQILRHRDLATTAVYAKVDLASLRSVALPWPGAAQ